MKKSKLNQWKGKLAVKRSDMALDIKVKKEPFRFPRKAQTFMVSDLYNLQDLIYFLWFQNEKEQAQQMKT